MPVEKVGEGAAAASEWIVQELESWRKLEKELKDGWEKVPKREIQRLGKEALELLPKRPSNGWDKSQTAGQSKVVRWK